MTYPTSDTVRQHKSTDRKRTTEVTSAFTPIGVPSMPGDWRQDAACAGMTPEESDRIFFPNTTTSSAAKALCGGCMVRNECREFARKQQIEFGIFAGETPRERGIETRTHRLLDPVKVQEMKTAYFDHGVSVKKLMRLYRLGYPAVVRALFAEDEAERVS